MMTLRESLEKMVDTGRAGKLGARKGRNCLYRDELGNTCSIGCLLPESVLREMEEYNMLSSSLMDIIHWGRFTPEEYGFDALQARTIQRWHDMASRDSEYVPGYGISEFIEVIEGLLNGDFNQLSFSPVDSDFRVSFEV